MTGDAIKQTKVVPIGDLCQIVSRMAGSRHGTADWHFATGHFGRKRAIRRRGRGAPANGTGADRRTDEPATKRRGGSRGGKFRPRARGRAGGADEPAEKRRGGGKRGTFRPMARGSAGGTDEPAAKRRGGGRREKLRPMAREPAGCADEPATKRSDGGRKEKLRPRARGPAGGTKKACAAAGPYPEVRTTYIIGSVRRGYALQRRESSCRPT